MSSAPKAVFLSYAREDADAARRIADALRAFGVEVWFDQNELRGGDAWDAKIKKQIRDCALFLPMVSARTQERTEGYFRREWKLAVERTHDMAASRAFIVPVVIDATTDAGADVPEEFLRVQWTRLPNGVPSPQFVEQVKRLLEEPTAGRDLAARRPSLVGDNPGQRGETSLPRGRQQAPVTLALVAIVLVVLGVGGWLWTRSARPAALAEPKPASSTPAAASAPQPAPAATDKSVAVLAFSDLSEARNSEYFSDGISEELLNVLAKVPGLRVAARTSAFFFKGRNVPIPEIAAKLNVAYVVEGSVRRVGDRVRITAQLIKAADGYHVWSENFDREIKDVLAVQDEIAGVIAKTLQLKLGTAPAPAALNPEAYRLYLEGRQAWMLRNPAGYDRAEKLFRDALALDPNFTRALTGLVDTEVVRSQDDLHFGHFSVRNSPELARIRRSAEQALALDPTSAEAHTSLGSVLHMVWRLEESEQAYRRAIHLNPNYATAHQWLGRVLESQGRIEEAVAAERRAAELDPLASRILDNYSLGLLLAGRFDEALIQAERALETQPGSRQALGAKTAALSALGRMDEAIAGARGIVDPKLTLALAAVLARAGRKAEARAALNSVRSDRVERTAKVYAELGDREQCLAALVPAELNVLAVPLLYFDPAFDFVRDDPRFRQALAATGLTGAHDRAQAWRAQQKRAGGKTK